MSNGNAPEPFDVVDVIRTKRDGAELSEEQIAWVVDAYARGVVADEQMSALAMAVFLRGLNRQEIAQWAEAMIRSGERMDFSHLGKITVDKHSTGGVGDKITLPLGPLVASFGVAVPQLSGRGLGHTGGTLDKLEAIPGWNPSMSNERMTEILKDVGAVVAAAGSGLAPADKKLYALRDITATVDCIPLIATSIMSKKIAEGTSGLVLDVKVGSGAFMQTLPEAKELAAIMVELGKDAGVNTRAFLTDMDVPLGRTIGNALEVRESVEVLAGGGPADVRELTLTLGRAMLELAGIPDADVAHALDSGKAMDARALGVGSWRLGAGRARKEDDVQATAGIEILAGYGEKVTKGQPLLTLHTETLERFERALEVIDAGLEITPTAPAPRTLIHDEIR